MSENFAIHMWNENRIKKKTVLQKYIVRGRDYLWTYLHRVYDGVRKSHRI